MVGEAGICRDERIEVLWDGILTLEVIEPK